MFHPIIEPFRCSQTPWQVFQKVYNPKTISFFLDSGQYHPPDQTYSYLGLCPLIEVRLKKDRVFVSGEKSGIYPAQKLFPLIRSLLGQYRNPSGSNFPFFCGGAVGYLGYECAPLFERVRLRKRRADPEIDQLRLGFYRDVIVYDHRRQAYFFVTQISSREGKKEMALRLNAMKKWVDRKSPPSASFRLKKFRPEISKKKFEAMVRRAKAYIAAGDIYQANLSQRFRFEFEGSPLRLYDRLRKINPSPFASFLNMGDLKVISNSPERLIRTRGRRCETRPIAGTYPRRRPGFKDEALEKEFLADGKERAEHLMLVDLERSDLGRVCDYRSVRVEEFMKIEKYSHVLHIVSKIVGRLKKGRDSLALIQAMFPGGTITGCPKIRCMEIIDELEPVGRGIYTGSIGYLDFNGNMDFNIVIRSLVLKGNQGYLQVGAGIVWDSDPGREYEETLHKGEALAEALLQASMK